jgi:hypothetical protein
MEGVSHLLILREPDPKKGSKGSAVHGAKIRPLYNVIAGSAARTLLRRTDRPRPEGSRKQRAHGCVAGERQLGQIVRRAWKGHDWEALNRLHEKGFIGNPVGKAKSVFVTEEGAKRSVELFRQFFGK